MSGTTDILDGRLMGIYNGANLIATITDCNLKIQHNVRESSNKNSGKTSHTLPGRLGWVMSGSGKFSFDAGHGANELFDLIAAQTEANFVVATANASDISYSGSGFLIDLEELFPDSQDSTFIFTLKGDAQLNKLISQNVYACASPYIYMQVNGDGIFNQYSTLSYPNRICKATNGNIYVSVITDDIYIQIGGSGNFTPVGTPLTSWGGITAAPNGNIYAIHSTSIYMQTNGSGAFILLTTAAKSWYGICAAPNGDIYACVNYEDIYKQSGGIGNFNALGQTNRQWAGICAAPNGDIYACVNGGDIYKQAGGIGNFNALGQTSRNWNDICSRPNGDIYACVNGGDIYMQTQGAGNFNALGQTSRIWNGLGA